MTFRTGYVGVELLQGTEHPSLQLLPGGGELGGHLYVRCGEVGDEQRLTETVGEGSCCLAVAVGLGRIVAAERAEVDIEVRVVRLGLKAEFVGGVLAEAADVLDQVRRDVCQVLWVDDVALLLEPRTISAMSSALWKITASLNHRSVPAE
ncbi:hypothetical protein [Streptomyces triticisoli]|jgi:hypothetical protein|uniref:hypothetical protein n=1 Tax=Streptomyces triticisoli TaxID=2182797 RepID=UPI001E4695DD|nr:hypothetical protein [Streptomyces triticisoli]